MTAVVLSDNVRFAEIRAELNRMYRGFGHRAYFCGAQSELSEARARVLQRLNVSAEELEDYHEWMVREKAKEREEQRLRIHNNKWYVRLFNFLGQVSFV